MESVYNQTFLDFEHIIIDGKSNDNTVCIAKNKALNYRNGSIRIYSEEDQGIYDAMNKGIMYSKGEYICFMNAGDSFFDRAVLESVAKIMEEREADIYYGDAISVYPNGEIRFLTRYHYEDKLDLREQIFRNNAIMPMHQAIFASQSSFVNNMFDIKIKLRAEFKWFAQCVYSDLSVCDTKIPICYYMSGGESEKSKNAMISLSEIDEIRHNFRNETEDNINLIYNIKTQYAKVNTDFSILDMWLALKEAKKPIEKYFHSFNYLNIAVYGVGILGNHFISEIKHTNITIRYLIDNHVKDAYCGIKTFSLSDFLEPVDAIIVTPVFYYDMIKNDLENVVKYPIISLEEVLMKIWEL